MKDLGQQDDFVIIVSLIMNFIIIVSLINLYNDLLVLLKFAPSRYDIPFSFFFFFF